MTVRVSVNYNDSRWRRCDLKRYVTLLVSKVIQTHQMGLNNFSLSILACSDSKIKELNKIYRKKNRATNVFEMVIKEVEKPMLEEVMKFCNGNKSQASKILGINRVTLRTKLKQYNIKNG